MKFIKGMLMGSLISAGIMMSCMDDIYFNKHKLIKKGKQIAKKMGVA